MASETHRAIDAVWRIESPKVIATLARMTHDVGLAEELAQGALVAALEQWPESGVPDHPGAWLMATAKHKAIDRLRRNTTLERKQAELARQLETQQETAVSDIDAALEDDRAAGDDLLGLIFTACHPVLSTEARVALTLRLLGGLTTDEIARAFLVRESTIAQRIVRAKRTLAEAHVPFEVPRGSELTARLPSVLEVVYLVFNEGYSATAGDDWMRPALCEDATQARPRPRRAPPRGAGGPWPRRPDGDPGAALPGAARAVGGARPGARPEPGPLGPAPHPPWPRRPRARRSARWRLRPYALQAAIAACHARARVAEETNWVRIAALYDALAQIDPSPVVELNRAMALAMAFGPEAGLEVVDTLTSDPQLAGYHWLPSVRGDLLVKLGRLAEARREFERAASLTRNTREGDLLLQRAADCTSTTPP